MTLIGLAVAGVCLFLAGVALVAPPLALMVAGAFMVAAAYLIAEERDV